MKFVDNTTVRSQKALANFFAMTIVVAYLKRFICFNLFIREYHSVTNTVSSYYAFVRVRLNF